MVGIKTTGEERQKIRDSLNDPDGYLPNDRQIIRKILDYLNRQKTAIYFFNGKNETLDSFTYKNLEAKELALIYFEAGHFSPIFFEGPIETP